MGVKHPIDFVRREFKKVGYTLLTDEYENVCSPMPFRCKKGHKHKISLYALRKGVRCSKCRGNNKHSLEEIREKFSQVGYRLLSTEYKNNKQLLDFECDKGHKHRISFGKFRAGRRCKFCSREKSSLLNKSRRSLEQVKDEFFKVGYKPLFNEYKNVHTPLPYRCDKGHYSKIRLNDLIKGQRCSSCVGGVKKSTQDVKDFFIRVGYKPLFDEYKNKRQKLDYVCPKGHKNSIDWSNFKAGSRCPVCFQDRQPYIERFTLEEARQTFIDVGYKPLFTSYIGAHQLLLFECDKGHRHKIRLYSLKSGQRCRTCMNSGFSRDEKELLGIIKELGFRTEENYRRLIGPKELDIFIPEKNLAIEYCGLYWHSEISGGKDRRYHYNKRVGCERKNIRLITIFSDEYKNKQEVVISRIKSALGKSDFKIYGRSCTVKKIDSSVYNEFLEKYHLQGSSQSKIGFGLFYKGNIIGVMTGGHLSRKHTSLGKTLELKRLCFLPNHSVVGGASKLFKKFLQYSIEEGFHYIKSYQDMRWGNPFNPVYEKLGFELLSDSKYAPHYVLGNKRYRNQSLRKTPEERKTGKTEWELRREQGYDRIWDCGHRTYLYLINK